MWCNVHQITCIESEEAGSTELYLTAVGNTNYRQPSGGFHRLDNGEVWHLQRSFEFDELIKFHLWDEEDTSAEDHLGENSWYAAEGETAGHFWYFSSGQADDWDWRFEMLISVTTAAKFPVG